MVDEREKKQAPKSSPEITELAPKRQTLTDLDKLETDLDEMTRKADAAYNIMQTSKTVEIRPKQATSKRPPPTQPPPKPKPKSGLNREFNREPTASYSPREDDAKLAEENKRLADEIAKAQAVLAQLKPNIKPKGSKAS